MKMQIEHKFMIYELSWWWMVEDGVEEDTGHGDDDNDWDNKDCGNDLDDDCYKYTLMLS